MAIWFCVFGFSPPSPNLSSIIVCSLPFNISFILLYNFFVFIFKSISSSIFFCHFLIYRLKQFRYRLYLFLLVHLNILLLQVFLYFLNALVFHFLYSPIGNKVLLKKLFGLCDNRFISTMLPFPTTLSTISLNKFFFSTISNVSKATKYFSIISRTILDTSISNLFNFSWLLYSLNLLSSLSFSFLILLISLFISSIISISTYFILWIKLSKLFWFLSYWAFKPMYSSSLFTISIFVLDIFLSSSHIFVWSS